MRSRLMSAPGFYIANREIGKSIQALIASGLGYLMDRG